MNKYLECFELFTSKLNMPNYLLVIATIQKLYKNIKFKNIIEISVYFTRENQLFSYADSNYAQCHYSQCLYAKWH